MTGDRTILLMASVRAHKENEEVARAPFCGLREDLFMRCLYWLYAVFYFVVAARLSLVFTYAFLYFNNITQ